MTAKDYWFLTTQWDLYHRLFHLKDTEIIENNETGAYCVLGFYYDTLIISFKGTELSLKDILTDMLFVKSIIPYNKVNPLIKVHSGFLLQYLSIRNQLKKFIENQIKISNKNEKLKIKIIGHSLGAALGTLCILDLQYNYKDNLDLSAVVFGSPRIGNKYFKKSFEGRIKKFDSYQNVNDLVCKIPLRMMGFEHVGNIIKIDRCQFPFISIKKHLEYDKYL